MDQNVLMLNMQKQKNGAKNSRYNQCSRNKIPQKNEGRNAYGRRDPPTIGSR
jgi:hypothetical protein